MKSSIWFYLVVLILLLAFCGTVFAASKSISAFDAAYAGNKVINVTYQCTSTDTSTTVLVTATNTDNTQYTKSYLLSPANNCTTAKKVNIPLTDLALPSNKLVSVTLSVAQPCDICSRSVFIYSKEALKIEPVPDNSLLVVLLALCAVVFIISKKRK